MFSAPTTLISMHLVINRGIRKVIGIIVSKKINTAPLFALVLWDVIINFLRTRREHSTLWRQIRYRVGISSWDFELGFRVGLSSWTFELDFRVGLSSWTFELDFRVGLSSLDLELDSADVTADLGPPPPTPIFFYIENR